MSSTSIPHIDKDDFDEYLDKILVKTMQTIDFTEYSRMYGTSGADSSLEFQKVWKEWRQSLTLAFFSHGGYKPESGKGPCVFRKLEWHLLEFLAGEELFSIHGDVHGQSRYRVIIDSNATVPYLANDTQEGQGKLDWINDTNNRSHTVPWLFEIQKDFKSYWFALYQVTHKTELEFNGLESWEDDLDEIISQLLREHRSSALKDLNEILRNLIHRLKNDTASVLERDGSFKEEWTAAGIRKKLQLENHLSHASSHSRRNSQNSPSASLEKCRINSRHAALMGVECSKTQGRDGGRYLRI
ncbi:hypothetical protein JCM3765_000146 [Sporobolomyces pararoseus]